MTIRIHRLVIFGLVLFSAHGLEAGATTRPARIKKVQATVQDLTDAERNSLRFKLESIWNEVDLLVRNANSDRLDVQRQEREQKLFRVFEKIPLASGPQASPDALVANIKKSAAGFGMQVKQTKVVQVSKPEKPIPASVSTDQPNFRLDESQMVEKVRMELVLDGTKDQLQKWMDSWTDVANPSHADDSQASLTPFLEWDPQATGNLPEALSQKQWKIKIQAYRYRDIQFPKLKPRDPLDVLPEWAQKNPMAFQAKEPLLWSFVERTHKTLPQALPQYELKERFLLNGARMDFFTAKLGHG